MHQVQRHQAILKAIAEHHVVTVTNLTNFLGVSEATVRRDIREMAEGKLLRKIHGGAEALDQAAQVSLSTQPFESTVAVNSEQKRAIASTAAQMCHDGESIMIGGGTTTQKMVEYLLNRRITVLTNSLVVAIPLIEKGCGRVILAGGEAYRAHNVVLSPFDHDSFENHRVSKLFIGAMCIGLCGVLEGDPLLVRVGQRMINQAEQVILLVDSSKFHRMDGTILCPLERVTRIVTDDGIDEQTLRMFEQAGVPVTVAVAAPSAANPAA
ncbi:DeoR/GlpR family DNA-binding transcription regulator [Telmatospirillum sp.]|uniref:DeoR/GlpR family DNA-binding transcription regulator n=1 Tax=Telmatospirillum sp. TaxID=2079197 RepID=UPI00284E5749|nr:DeoR/GlpR family DNA-binding transcription regulator [Telmatospirillum sp.]MDR3439144.1 DeoR/GlpR family DNA-binding transcription regulator [Telmatospirillum sp.]